MGRLQEELYYIRGLMDGMEVNSEEKRELIIKKVVEFLEKAVNQLETLENNYQNLRSYIENVDKDLGDLEAKIYPQKESLNIRNQNLEM